SIALAGAVALLPAPPVLAQSSSDRPVWRPVIMGRQAMIAAEHPLEAMAAQKVLEAGGNAIDAAVAAFYMTTVVEHHQAGIGGDAFIMIYLSERNEVVFINGTGVAPRQATRERYLGLGGIPDAGPFSSSVPGAVAGFDLALRKYGTRSYPEVLAPAIEAASQGHPLSVWGASMHASSVDKVAKYPGSARLLLREGAALKAGDLFVQADLGRTLQAIARGGAEAFYRGEIARGIASFYQAHGGLITLEDLAGITAEEASPIRTDYRGYEVVQSAPNSQGIAMLIALEILEGYDLKALGQNSADYVHLLTEALKLAFADRNHYIGDPRFVKDMPVEALLSPEYAAARRSLIRMDRSIEGEPPPGDPRLKSAVLGGREIRYRTGTSPQPPGQDAVHTDAGETSSFSIADRFGNVVSVTHSVNGTFGSGMIVDGLGFVLNNRMPYFSLEAGDVNVLEPGKRPRHTINPAMAFKDGKPFLAWNTPGGDNQPQAMLQAFLNVVEFGMNVQQAVEAPTLTSSGFRQSNYPQDTPGRLALPKVLADLVGPALASRGHLLQVTALQGPYRQAPAGAGAVKMVMLDHARGVMFGGVSPAKDNYVIGW
ncbi:MAG TPA: gamma-glutamyltransferase, partial [Gemmatimonadales bacterium]